MIANRVCRTIRSGHLVIEFTGSKSNCDPRLWLDVNRAADEERGGDVTTATRIGHDNLSWPSGESMAHMSQFVAICHGYLGNIWGFAFVKERQVTIIGRLCVNCL